MSAQPALRLVSDHATDFPWPDGNGELISLETAIHRVKNLLYDLEGMRDNTQTLAGKVKKLEKQLEVEADPTTHPKGKEIVALFELWQRICNHPNSRRTDDRIKLIRKWLKSYTIEELTLTVHGLAAYPYRVYDKRLRTGRPQDRHDQLSDAFGDSEKIEKLANLGTQAKREGWTEEGWPNA